MSSLSPESLKTIRDYLHLPIGSVFVNCPYYNNRRAKVRGGLRALIGKGSVDDIVEEATIIALREKVDLKKIDAENLKKFLVNSYLGIDCSGLAYHILDTELKARGLGSLKKYLRFPFIKNILRKFLTILRPVESAGVRTICHEQNCVPVDKIEQIQPGDLVAIIGGGEKQDRNHVLIVHEVTDNQIKYTHSMQWQGDGEYNHGVRQSEIQITDKNKGLLDQTWLEPEALTYARQAREVKVWRLRVL